MTPLEIAIIDKLCKYIDGVITLKQFSEWFVPMTLTVSKEETRASRLIYIIKLRFGQFSDNAITKNELRESLIDLIL